MNALRGTVKETMDSGGYTYVLLATQRGDVWAAARQFPATAGDEVEIAGMMPMHDFHSATLDRTFEEIQFVSQARVIVGGTATGPHQPGPLPSGATMPPGHPPIGDVAASAQVGQGGTVKPGEVVALADGVTVAQVLERSAELSGKTVKFRGRVVKANRNILSRNWMHIQDGTGAAGSNDITVTSSTGFAPVGSVVVIEGTVVLDQDFGAGYAYPVLVEDATVSSETP
ncbi:MAG: nucleotide-binding protein [Phycisphaerae bacterium]|jgi:hypothetical protein